MIKLLIKKEKLEEHPLIERYYYHKEEKDWHSFKPENARPDPVFYDNYLFKGVPATKDDRKVAEFVTKCFAGEFKPVIESSHEIIITSKYLFPEELVKWYKPEDKTPDKYGIKVVKFYKDKCSSCSAMKPFYEDLTRALHGISKEVNSGNYQDSVLLKKYGVKNPEKFMGIEAGHFDTQNQVTTTIIRFLSLGES